MGIVRDLYYARKMSAGLKLPAPTVALLIKRLALASMMSGGSGELRTVTGNAPLTLEMAIEHAIHSITQYGLCDQASTPTPASPVGIKCNNGELKMVDDELPDGYKRVLGFACNNNAMWEIPDFHLKGSDTVRISFSVEAACNVFGCYQGTDATDNYDLYVSTTSGSKYLRYGNGTYLSYWSNANLGRRFDVVFGPTGTQGMPDDSTWTERSFTSANDLLIGSTTTTGTSSKLKGNLYGNIVVDGRLKLIPCERVSDNVLGYYDTYSETFYEPATGFDGATSLGYDGSHYQLEVVGTPEVLTVSGKNLFNPDETTDGKYIGSSGSIGDDASSAISGYIPVTVGEKYTWSFVTNYSQGSSYANGNRRMHGYKSDGTWKQQLTYYNVTGSEAQQYTLTATIPSGVAFVRLSEKITDENIQFEHSDNATSYQPYVPPQTASVSDLLAVDSYADTQEIISGLVDRKIDFVILDGTEDGYGASSAYGAAVYIGSASTKWKANRNGGVLCTHFVQGTASGTQPENTCFFNASGHFYFRTDKTTAQFKTWLAEQYAAGTPVMVMFVRSTPTTESVTPQPLTTAEGTNTVSVTAEVSPIELEAVYMMERGIEKSVSGTLVHITDALPKPATSVLASIEPVQSGSGTPAPDNVRPISGLTGLSVYRTGKNLIDPAKKEIATGSTTTARWYKDGTGFLLHGGQTYALSGNISTDATYFVYLYDMGGTQLAYGKWTATYTPAADVYVYFQYYESGGAHLADAELQLELGSSATTYEPYNGTTYAIDWTSQAGTVYGGTLDVVTGVLTVDRAKVTFDGSSTTGIGVYNALSGFYFTLPGMSASYSADGMCNMANTRTSYGTGGVIFGISKNSYAYFTNLQTISGASDVTGLNSWLTTNNLEIEFVYPLATPQTYQLTAQEVQMLTGDNYVWSSSGDDVSVTYYAEGNANNRQALRILLGDSYSNPGMPDDASDKEALNILLGGNK